MVFEIYTLILGLFIGAVLVYAAFRTQWSRMEGTIRAQSRAELEQWKVTTLAETVQSATVQSLNRARAVLKGKIGEQLAPLLPEFLAKYSPGDARFLGTPIDYIIFRNMSNKEEGVDPIEVVLLDVKTGAASLNKIQKMIKEAVENGRVRFETLRLDGDATERPEQLDSSA